MDARGQRIFGENKVKYVELFDALTPTGLPTGQQKTKQQIFNDGDWRLVTHAWLVTDDNQVLCQRRAFGKGFWDGLWDVSVGGGVASGEDSLAACVRELAEELGLVVDPNDLVRLGRFETSKPLPEQNIIAKEFSDTYVVRLKPYLGSLILQDSEVSEVCYIPLDQVGVNNGREWVPHPQTYYQEIRQLILGGI